MSHEVPEDHEVWQDSEGMLSMIIDDGRRIVIFGGSEAYWIEHLDPADKPLARLFTSDGEYVGPPVLNKPDFTKSKAEYRAEFEERHRGYDERCAAAGLVKLNHGDHVHHETPGGDAHIHIVEVGPDGVREVSTGDADLPEPIRRVLAAAAGEPPAEPQSNSFGAPPRTW